MMKRKLKNAAMKYSMYMCGFFVVAVLVFTIGYILYRGVPGLSLGFITGQTSYITGKIGIMNCPKLYGQHKKESQGRKY